MTHATDKVSPTIAMPAKMTHRCPLACPYCSTPIDLALQASELPTDEWERVFAQAAKLGALQLHHSGGEPALRRDLVQLTAAARGGVELSQSAAWVAGARPAGDRPRRTNHALPRGRIAPG